MDDLLLPPGVKGLKGILESFKEKSDEIRSIFTDVFFEKAVLKIFREIPRKPSTTEHILKAHNSVAAVFLGISRKYSAILIENLPMYVPYFIKEHLRVSASDEAH